jgi:hypothetical protein
LLNKPAWAKYSASDWSGTTLPDSTGNGRNATTSGVSSGSGTGFGATGSINYLTGNTTNTITFPSGSIPATFTIASITRVSAGTNGRLLKGLSTNWIHGHLDAYRGIAYYNGWKTAGANMGTFNNWLGCVGTNSTSVSAPNNVLLDGTASGSANGGSGTDTLVINVLGGYTPQACGFGFSQLIIWDVALTTTEMATVATALNTYLSTGVLQ